MHNNSLRKVTLQGAVSTFAGSTSGWSGFAEGVAYEARFYVPHGVAADLQGNLR